MSDVCNFQLVKQTVEGILLQFVLLFHTLSVYQSIIHPVYSIRQQCNTVVVVLCTDLSTISLSYLCILGLWSL